ncbi:unnamed protein product, partial [Meganyctiphanes norvegica]
MSAFLDVRSFIQMAQEEDLFVIFRPGPYICAEWEFGGMPSWLLRDHTMHLRSYYEGYRTAAAAFFDALLPLVNDLQFTNGGPIIMVQIENEFGHFGYEDFPRDTLYLEFLQENLISNGMGESLFFTSDSVSGTGDLGSLPGVLMTANFKTGGDTDLTLLKELQPDRPLMVTEFWTGWFDHWLADVHIGWNAQEFAANLEMILQHNSSVNLYMFIGGTSFGFMAGANTIDVFPHYAPDVTSYDYDAVLTEAGDYTEKYDLAMEIIKKYNPTEGIVDHPLAPAAREKTIYATAAVEDVVYTSTLLNMIDHWNPDDSEIMIVKSDLMGKRSPFGAVSIHMYIRRNNIHIELEGYLREPSKAIFVSVATGRSFHQLTTAPGHILPSDKSLAISGSGASELIILVENLGRANYGVPHKLDSQRKGITEGPVKVDGVQVDEWLMIPLEFTRGFMNNLTMCNCWLPYSESLSTPAVYRTHVDVSDPPMDTFVDMRAWNKGVVFVNGFNLGRYWSTGPQKTLYLPAPLLTPGYNEIMIFEQYEAADEIVFT